MSVQLLAAGAGQAGSRDLGSFTLAAIIVLALLSGLLIGCIGIGGVVLVPALHYLGGIPIHTAIGAAMMAFLVSGLVGTIVFGNKQSIKWDMAPWLWAGAMPGALLGAWTSSAAPAALLELAIGALTAVSGIHALTQGSDRTPATSGANGATLSTVALASVGAFTGFASSLTGTGGPLVLVPILMWLRVPVLTAIGLAQAIQLPIAVMATGGNYAAGTLDLQLGALLGLGLAAGTWGGAHLAHALPRAVLFRIVAAVLVGIGIIIVVRIALRLID